MSQSAAEIVSSLIAVIFALGVIAIRLKASNRPTNIRKILIPPLSMSTGFLMYMVPQMRESWLYAGMALLVGILFSYPLIATSKMYRAEDGQVYIKRSKGFALILLGLLALRMVLHTYVEQYVSLPQTASLFFVLAFGMIVPWRLAMFIQYRRLQGDVESRVAELS